MKKIRDYPRLRRYHQRQLDHVLQRRRSKVTYKYKWRNRTPLIEEGNRRQARKNWEDHAIHLTPPADFVLFRNPEPVIKFFNQVEQHHSEGKDVYLNLDDISDLTSDTMLLLFARTTDERFNYNRIAGGSMPSDLSSRMVFEESGVFGNKSFDLTIERSQKGSIRRFNNFLVSPRAADDMLYYVSDYFVSREQSAANYETLIELMSNTNIHAGGETIENELWWCSVYALPERALFNFLDNGKGICETAIKRIGHHLLQTLGFTNNAGLLNDIMNDKVISRTGKYYHGRGLPLVRRRAEKGLIENVIIITNNVYANISTGEYRTMDTTFHGTFVHWEVSSK